MGWKYSYYWAMIIFVIHNNRSEILSRLEAKPEELVPMFNKKARKLGFVFTGNVPKIIDIQKVKEICDSLENISDEKYFKRVNGLLNDDIKSLPMSYLIYILANVKSSDVILDSNFQYGSVIKQILNYNHEQRIDGFEATLLYDFVLIFAYCMNAKNINLYHGEFVPNRKEYDKALSIIDNDLLNPDIEELLETDVDNPATEMVTLKYFLKKEENDDIFRDIDSNMSQVKANGPGVFGVSEKKLEMRSIVKEEYIRNEWIDTVIQLPGKVNYHQNIILIVRKNKRKTNQYIRMIKSPTIFDKLKLKFDKQKIDRIVKSVNNSKEYSGFVRNVPLDEIKENNNSLIPSRYVQKYTFDLQDDLSVQIDYSQLEDDNTYRLSNIARVYTDGESKTEADLIIYGSKIYIDVTSKNISKDWLIEFIHSPVGKVQLNQLGLENIGNLRIPIIPVEKQKESIQKFNDVKQKVENINASLDEVEKEINQRLYDSMGISDTFEIIDKKNLPD